MAKNYNLHPYEHLPDITADMLIDWTYKGVRPTHQAAGPIMPTASFLTVDLKLPESGPAKILEINGYDSGLDAYGEERSEYSIMERANAVHETLGPPVARFRWEPKANKHFEITRNVHPFKARRLDDMARLIVEENGDSIGASSNLSFFQSQMIGEWLNNRRNQVQEGKPTTVPEIKDISDAAAIIELSDSWQLPWQDFDPVDSLIANSAELRLLEEDKIAFASLAHVIFADKYRPRYGQIYTVVPSMGVAGDHTLLSDAEKVVLKFPHMDAGMGVTVLSSEELKAVLSLSDRLGSWDSMLRQLSGHGFASNAEASIYRNEIIPQAILVEEYIESKPVKSPDGREYDATMRIAISSLANRGKITVVPLGAYWKLPENPIGAKRHSDVSRVKEGGSLPVNEQDFRRAFHDTADFMTRVLKHTRTLKSSNYWPRGQSLKE